MLLGMNLGFLISELYTLKVNRSELRKELTLKGESLQQTLQRVLNVFI